MPASPDQMLIGCHVDRGLGARFKAWAACNQGGAAAALRALVTKAVEEVNPPPPPGSSGYRVTVRLKDADRIALLKAAQARSTTPANWLRSLAVVHLGRRPQWADAEAVQLREIGMEVRRIGNNVNQIARAMNIAAHKGEYPPAQGEAAREAADLVRVELRRLMAIYTGNFDYWGLPDADRPTSLPGMEEREQARETAEKARRRLRPRRRPAVFADDEREAGKE